MRLVLGDLRDQYTGDDGVTVVMVGHQVLLLSPLASEVLRCLSDEPVGLGTLGKHVRSVLGEPAAGVDSEALLEALVTDLARSGAVRIVSST